MYLILTILFCTVMDGSISIWEIKGLCMPAKSLQSCPTLCDLMGCSPGSSVHGILQAIILEWVALPYARGSSWPRDQIWVSRIAGGFFTTSATWGQWPPPNTSIYIYKQLQKTAIHCSILQNVKETFCYLLHEEISQRTYPTDLP